MLHRGDTFHHKEQTSAVSHYQPLEYTRSTCDLANDRTDAHRSHIPWSALWGMDNIDLLPLLFSAVH
jgi:hypothetical protein